MIHRVDNAKTGGLTAAVDRRLRLLGHGAGAHLVGAPRFRGHAAVSDKWAGGRLGDRLPLARRQRRCGRQSQADGVDRLGRSTWSSSARRPRCRWSCAARAGGGRARGRSVGRVPAARGGLSPLVRVHPRLSRAAGPGGVFDARSDRELRARSRGARWWPIPAAIRPPARWRCCRCCAAGVIEREGVIIDAKSGTTGAGQEGDARSSPSPRSTATFAPIACCAPAHARDRAGAGDVGRGAGPVTFTAHLLPTRRGILATAYGRLRPGKTAADAAAAIRSSSGAGVPARRRPMRFACRRWWAPTAWCWAPTPIPSGRGVGFSAIDNLVKGAAGQAVQNANLMFGLDETAGLGNSAVRPVRSSHRKTWRLSVAASKGDRDIKVVCPQGFRSGATAAGI